MAYVVSPRRHQPNGKDNKHQASKVASSGDEAPETHRYHKTAPMTSHLKCLGEKVGRERGPSLDKWEVLDWN
jgi:hypothetical protein